MRASLLHTALFSAVLLLAACGGGSGTSQSPSAPTDDASGLPSDQRVADLRQSAGGDASELSNSEHDARVLAVVGSGDSWIGYGGLRDTGPGAFDSLDCNSQGCGEVTAESFAADVYSSQEHKPVLTKDGVHVRFSRYTSAAETPEGEPLFEGSGFSGLLEHGYFHANAIESEGQAPEINVIAIGDAAGLNPLPGEDLAQTQSIGAFASPASNGAAMWSGPMVGVSADGWVYGNVALTFDFQEITLDVAFSDVVGIYGSSRMFELDPWEDIPVANGTFQANEASRSIRGAFYGPSSQEIGGVFVDRGEAVAGAFGATREDASDIIVEPAPVTVEPPMLSAAEHAALMRTHATGADYLNLGVWVAPPGGPWDRVSTSCSGNGCTGLYPGETTTAATVFANPDTTYTPIVRRNGTEIHRTRFSGSNVYGSFTGHSLGGIMGDAVFMMSGVSYGDGTEGAATVIWGDAANSNPPTGTAVWSGTFLGGANGLASTPENPVGGHWLMGDTTVTFEFATNTVDVTFANINGYSNASGDAIGRVGTGAADRTFLIAPWRSLSVTDGTFESRGGGRELEGAFFGEDAGEVAALVADYTSNSDFAVTGVFGAVRDN